VPRFLRRELTVQLSFHFNLFEKVVEISQNHPPVRGNEENLLTLVTLQKDNPLQWIKDWIRWHNHMHGVGRLILYDNGSREYGYDELAEACTSEENFLWDTKTIQIFGKYACQCNGSFLMGIHSIDYGSLKRFSELLRLKLSSIVKRMQKLFRYHNKITHKHNLPRETFWVHHFALLASPCAPKPEK